MPTPSLKTLAFGAHNSTDFVHIISNILTLAECEHLIISHSNLVPSNVTSQTIRDREMFFDQSLSERLWSRIEQYYGHDTVTDEEGSTWKAIGLNEKFRLCRYGPGGKFSPHQDGQRLADLNVQSFMTVNIYLNNVSLSSLGSTRILHPTSFSKSKPSDPTSFEVLAKIQPTQGSAAVFRYDLWHDGEELVSGVKYLLRTDVLYERCTSFDFDALYGNLSDAERGKKAFRVAASLEDAGNSAQAIEWYKKAFRLCPELDR